MVQNAKTRVGLISAVTAMSVVLIGASEASASASDAALPKKPAAESPKKSDDELNSKAAYCANEGDTAFFGEGYVEHQAYDFSIFGSPDARVRYKVNINNDASTAVQIKGITAEGKPFWKGLGATRNTLYGEVYWGNNVAIPAIRIQNLSGALNSQVSWDCGII